jgi:hypothetical protein
MKQMKLIAALLFGISSGAMAQSAVDASGGEATGSGGTSSYAVGQVVYTAISGSNGLSSQGVQQPYEFFTGIDENENISLSMNIFPNPAESTISLQIALEDLQNLSFQLFDMNGKLVVSQKVKSTLTDIPMSTYAPGNYFLNVNKASVTAKSFKIVKN